MRAWPWLALVWSVFPAWGGVSAVTAWNLGELRVEVPAGFVVEQTAFSKGTWLLTVGQRDARVMLRVGAVGTTESLSLSEEATRGVSDRWEGVPGLRWQIESSSYRVPGDRSAAAVYTVSFSSAFAGRPLYGYARGRSVSEALSVAKLVLAGVRPAAPADRSLPNGPFYGQKYYLGFGDYLSGFMGNEVKYDINHTHDIFTKKIGGEYQGTKLIGPNIGPPQLRQHWADLKGKMLWNDMYVQYSSGHGFESGLGFGVSYNEIRDAVLSLPARELIVFTMACHSGGLVDSFNAKRSTWEPWKDYGRTLFVMASSKLSELSSTGPMTDPQEPGGPQGSAGSAFGHALWKALIGGADGYGDGVKDGYISLGEIAGFTVYKTQQVGGHTPVVTGIYARDLVMNQVPSRAELEELENGGGEGPVPIARLAEWQVESSAR